MSPLIGYTMPVVSPKHIDTWQALNGLDSNNFLYFVWSNSSFSSCPDILYWSIWLIFPLSLIFGSWCLLFYLCFHLNFWNFCIFMQFSFQIMYCPHDSIQVLFVFCGLILGVCFSTLIHSGFCFCYFRISWIFNYIYDYSYCISW